MFSTQQKKKMSRVQYGIEEQIMEMLFRLNDKKSSELFKQPVDGKIVHDYYDRIKKPMDLSTIANNLKDGKYVVAQEVLDDLNLIISNCEHYNSNNIQILKKSESFNQCIKTEWTNFLKEISKKNIDSNSVIEVTSDIQERLINMEEKRRKRKAAASYSILEPDKRRFGENEYEYYTHINEQALKGMQDDKSMRQEDPFSEFEIKVEDFPLMSQDQKKDRMRIEFDEPAVIQDFEKNCKRKLDKYRRILNKKIKWCENKILRKIMNSRKYANLSVPPHLIKFIEQNELVKSLNIRKLQLFVKQFAYWMKEFQYLLGDNMKEKFLNNCKAIRKCIVQIVKYRRIIPKSTKIKLDNPFLQPKDPQQMDIEGFPTPPPPLPSAQPSILTGPSSSNQPEKEVEQYDIRSNSAETKSYEQKMKEFRRLLDRDVKEDRKKDMKILLVIQENGQIVSKDPVFDDEKKKSKTKKISGRGDFRLEPPKEDQDRRREEELKEERERDRQFLAYYNQRNNINIILKYDRNLRIDWEADLERQLLQETPISFSIRLEK